MVSTKKPSTDPQLHTVALEGLFEITVSLNMHAMNFENSGKIA
jgi:hypothetical protein